MHHYQRLGIVDMHAVFQAILDHARDPASFPGDIELMGAQVGVSGLRLRTFAESPPCCSNPECKALPTHFAVERTRGEPSDTPQQRPYHLNLYGRNEHGEEVLFTHDHTVARGLGGEDRRDNTTTMCLPCNSRKGKLESQVANRRRRQEMIGRGECPPEQGPVSEKRLARQLRMLESELEHSGMGRAAFIAHCHEQAMEYRQTPLREAEAKERRRMADALGMSVEGYIHLRHIHNQRMLALHGATPKSNRVKPMVAAIASRRPNP